MEIQKDLLAIKADQSDRMGWLLKAGSIIAGKTERIADFYGFLETWGKVAVIIDQMNKGATEQEAVAKAQEALFDYSAIPLWLAQLRRHPMGTPFATFYFKALPALIRGTARNPHRVFMYYALPYLLGDWLLEELKDVDDEDVDRLRQALPEWLRDSSHTFIYPRKDASGRWVVVDFGYFLPWGAHVDTVNAMAKIARGDVEEGLLETTREFGIFGGPVPQLIIGLKTGIDPFTQRPIYRDTDPPPAGGSGGGVPSHRRFRNTPGHYRPEA